MSKILHQQDLGEQNVHQKVRKICQNLNCNKMMKLIKYSPENFTPALLVMLKTFRRSGGQLPAK